MQMVDSGQVGPDGLPAEADVEEVVPEEHELTAELRDVRVGHAQELVLTLDRLQAEKASLLQCPYHRDLNETEILLLSVTFYCQIRIQVGLLVTID